MRDIEHEIDKMSEILDICDCFDLTVPELNYFRKTYPDLVELIHAAFLFGYAQGMKGGE